MVLYCRGAALSPVRSCTGSLRPCKICWILHNAIMTHVSSRFHRQSIRLKGYDYAQPGAYFVTVVTYQRECLFGDVVNGEMVLNTFGNCVRDEWFRTSDLRSNIELYDEEMVVMPNHVHGIIWIIDSDQGRGAASLRPYQRSNVVPDSLGAIVRAFKSAVTYRINGMRDTRNAKVWQRNYYEHIIRDEEELINICNYIDTNPLNWLEDQLYPLPSPG